MIKRNELLNLSKQIAADVLAAGLPLDRDSAKSLEGLMACEVDETARWSDVSVGFSVDQESSWHRDARIEFRGETGWDDKLEDESGNIVANFKVRMNFRADSTDTANLDKAEAQLDLATRALKLAKELKAKYEGTTQYVVRTAAEEAERKAKLERDALISKVTRLTEFPRKGLRVGGDRQVDSDIYAGVPEGEYEVSFTNNYDTKKYRVKVRPGYVMVYRLS